MINPRLKRKIRVLTRDYKLRYSKKQKNCGETFKTDARIEISAEVCGNREQIVRTFYHELAHAYAWESGLNCTGGFEGDLEEMFAESLAALLVDLFDCKLPWER